MNDLLELENRKKIYNFIKENPGIHLSQISEILNISLQLIDYHLNYLSRYELITVVLEGGYKRCYIKGAVGVKEKKILSLLRQEIPLKIVLFLLKKPYSRYSDLLMFLGISSSLFSYHLKKLLNNNLISLVTVGGRPLYVINNEKEIVSIIIQYKPSSIFKMVNDTWVDFIPG